MRQIYLDYNATTPIAPPVLEAMQSILLEHFGSPSSVHSIGRAAAEALIDARERVAMLIGADSEEIVFTSGGTESNNLALKGVLLGKKPLGGGHLVTSMIEHPSVSESARWLEAWGYDVTFVRCNGRGQIDPQEVARAIRPETKLVSIMHANHETGVVQPLREISELCRQREVLLHSDASQSVGKISVNVDHIGADLLTLAGHKFYGPKGIGALYVRRGTPLSPIMHGAGHEAGLRAGMENVSGAIGMGRAAQLIQKSLGEAVERMEALRDKLWRSLRDSIGSGLTINGAKAKRLPNTLSINFPGVSGESLLGRVPEICAATGTVFHSGNTSMPATLAAMGLTAEVARGVVRLSLGWQTTEDEVTRAASMLLQGWESLRAAPGSHH